MVDEYNFATDHMGCSFAYKHLGDLKWKRGELPKFKDTAHKRFDRYSHTLLDDCDLRGATRELHFAPCNHRGTEFSAKRRLDNMNRAFHVLSPIFNRF